MFNYLLVKFILKLNRTKLEKKSLSPQQINSVLPKNLKYSEITDTSYKTSDDFNHIQRTLMLLPVKLRRFSENSHDCDDFAREFWSLAKLMLPNFPIGYCHVIEKSKKHAMNFFVYLDNGKPNLAYVEPQEGKIVKNVKPYLMIV